MDYIIIVAGGKGLRMGGDLPKQFMPIHGKPVLMRTLEQFYSFAEDLRIILVLPKDHQPYWKELCEKYDFKVPHQIADGGASRYLSSKSGLSKVPQGEQGVVMVHDGVRPFVSHEVIRRCMDAARRDGAAIPVMPVVETLRHIGQDAEGKETSVTVPRSEYCAVQTPQAFDIALAQRAFDQEDSPRFTDDASVIESLGHPVTLVEGNRENIKLTTPFDLVVAEALLSF